MTFSKKKALFALAATSLLSTQLHAASVSGSMDLSVTMPEILVLYHFDEVEINLSDAAATGSNDHVVSEGTATVTINTGGPSTGALSIAGTGGPTANAAAANGTLDVTLTSAWAVRSIAANDVTVEGSIESATLTHADGTSTIGVSDLSLDSANAAAPGGTITLPSGWNVQTGDISFELDLSAAAAAGTYESGATDTFLLTLTGN